MGKKRRSFRQRSVVQEHHLSYEPEVKVRLFKKEHYWVTVAYRFRPISKGFIKSLKKFIMDKEEEAVDL